MNISAPGDSAGRRQLLTDTLHITTASIVSLFVDRFGVNYSIPGMYRRLHRNGFTWKKPSGIPHKFCPEQQHQVMTHYEALKQAAGDSEPILFMDGVQPTQSTNLSCGWIRKGNGKRLNPPGAGSA